ncbi:MAG: hypothetical protein ING29_04495 [Azospirillum sp.]|nr:hypothetical protein [Azospirillum sp.]
MTPHRFRSFVLVAAVALSLAGCAFYASVGPGAHAIQGKLDVTLDSTWNRQVDGASNIWPETWTRNGPLLDTVHLAPGIEEGKALVNLPENALREYPRYRAGSSPTDIVAFVQGTLARTVAASDFELVEVAPAEVAGHSGIRFEFRFGAGNQGSFETDRHALGYAFERDKQLYLLLFHAAEIHYFAAGKPAFEAIVASARLPQVRAAAR